MNIIAIRGATTITNNTKEEILQKTEELLTTIIEENKIQIPQIISIIFTATVDITKVYPAVAARNIGITNAALMCMQEMYVEGSLPMCIRVMVQIQSAKAMDFKHIYLHEATRLRPDLSPSISIAIDGPAGAGKSTIAKEIAKKLGYVYIDTGAMYRAVAYYCKLNNIDWNKEENVSCALEDITIKITTHKDGQQIYLNDENISDFIRTQEIATGASAVAAYKGVREKLVKLQQDLALKTSVVMDGRDIGTHVLPKASLKIFLTASVSERANRRLKELQQRGYEVNFEEIHQDITNRDYNDSHREFSPLCKAPDAVEIDTTGKSIYNVVNEILELLKG